ncbi:MAG: elongation factor G [Andreesenia angusta]|nr:elongation factor G [Andreesenia angusta]
MNTYESDKIRNIAVLGHSGSGKSILKEAILFSTGEIEEPPTANKAMSSDMNLFSVEWKGYKYNFIDTPGYADFYSEVVSGISAAAGAIIIVDGTEDLQVGTDKALEITDELGIPKILFVNKIDSPTANYYKIIEQLRERYGKKIAPFHVPIGESEDFKGYVNVVELFAREYDKSQERCFTVDIPKDMDNEIKEVRDMLMESVAESDEVLLEKYFSDEEFDKDEIHLGLKKAVINGDLIPVLCGSTLKNIGVHTLMWMAKDYFPSPVDNEYDLDADFAGQVFKTIINSKEDKVSILKVLQGRLTANRNVFNVNKNQSEKISNIYGYTTGPIKEIIEASTGDIVAILNAESFETGDTISANSEFMPYRELVFPKPQTLSGIKSVDASKKKELLEALKILQEEDKALEVEFDGEGYQTVIGTQGELHLNTIKKKLEDKFGIKIEIVEYKVPYKETIKTDAKAEVKLNRTVDDRGEFAEVHLELSPIEEGFIFEDLVKGGVIPEEYSNYVEEGVREAVEEGVLGGYPVTNIKVSFYGGSYNPVDSNGAAFKEAAKMAFKKGLSLASPTLIEPIMTIRVTTKEDNIGDIMGDLTKRRAKIQGMEPADEMFNQTVIAEVPQKEILHYLNDLRSMTSGRGYFDMEFNRYEEVPEKITGDIIK